MEYKTDYSIQIHGGTPETNKAVLDAVQQAGNIPFGNMFSGCYRKDADGYAYIEDLGCDACRKALLEQSRLHPEVTIHLDASGEDKDDDWKARFRAGEEETIRKKETFDPFSRILLPGEKKPVTKCHTLIAATLVEVDYEGDPSPTLLTGETPAEVTDKVVKAIQRAERRGFKVSYNEQEIASFLAKRPKEARGGLRMTVYGWDNRFVLFKDTVKLP